MSPEQKPVIGIFLAAGKSSRMGENKLYLPLGNMMLGSHALLTAVDSKLDHVLVVVREEDNLSWVDSRLFTEVKKQRWTKVICSEAAKGQAFSIKYGLKAAIRLKARAVIVILADQPLLESVMINDLLTLYKEHDETEYVASSINGRIQPPILFSDSLFPMLHQLKGDKGARSVLRSHPAISGKRITYTEGKGFYDIDTKEDYKWVKNRMKC